MLVTRTGELPTVIKIEPNIASFIEYFTNHKRPENERHQAIKDFLEDKNKVWSGRVFKKIKDISSELYNDDLSSMFEQSKISTNTKTINKNSQANESSFNENYNATLIRLSIKNQFLDQIQFIKVATILKKLNFDRNAMCKITFSFNNINTCICIFNPDKNSNETLIINSRSKRYLRPELLQKCEDLISYLNKLVLEKTIVKRME